MKTLAYFYDSIDNGIYRVRASKVPQNIKIQVHARLAKNVKRISIGSWIVEVKGF